MQKFKINNQQEKGPVTKREQRKDNEMMILYGVKMPRHDLNIINQIASFFGEYFQQAKKILVQNYVNDKKIGGIIKKRNGFIPLELLLEEQKQAYERRLKSGDKPTINTLKVAFGDRGINESPEPSGRRITPKTPGQRTEINYAD